MPRPTIKLRLAGKSAPGMRPGRKPLLTQELETKLADFASNKAVMRYGFGKSQFMQYAAALGNKHGRGFKRGRPSQQWWFLYNRRNKRLSLRQSEVTSTIRHKCLELFKVPKYFVALESELASKELLAALSRIWNMDETGLTLEHKPRKIVAAKGVQSIFRAALVAIKRCLL